MGDLIFMKETGKRLTAGQMAKFHGINRRTLHYYDEIGLFSPIIKSKENGYRYYTIEQSQDLELILAFRELGMSIEETKEAIHCEAKDVDQILDNKIAEIQDKIRHLQSMKQLLTEKQNLARAAKQAVLGKVEEVVCEEELIYISHSIGDKETVSYYKLIQEFADHDAGTRIFNQNYGTMVSSGKVYEGRSKYIDHVYIKPDKKKNRKGTPYLKPGGTYLQIVEKGSWDKLPAAYEKLVDYAEKHRYRLTGFSFEKGLNETLNTNMDEYVTELLIRCEPK